MVTIAEELKTVALIIHESGEVELGLSLDYEDISKAVGGQIQMLPRNSLGLDLTIYVNEEGKMKGLEPNDIGSALVGKENLLFGDYIVGGMWIGGPVNDEGEETPLPFESYYKILKFCLANGGRLI